MPYGIDRNAKVLGYARQMIHDISGQLEGDYPTPILRRGDYESQGFPGYKFSDGMSPKDMDLFFVFAA